jgi:predicted nucleic acid-binding protein
LTAALYLDTSSLLKFHIEEEGSDSIRRLMDRSPRLAMSRIGYPEARGGLARAQRAARLDAAGYAGAVRTFEAQWSGVIVIELSDVVSRLAGSLAARHFLRGLDGIHLASALTLQQAIAESVTFSAWDTRLLQAAGEEGLVAAPIES